MKSLSKQSRELRTLVIKRFALSLLIYCCTAMLAFVLFNNYLSPAIGELVADSTSQWEYTTLDELNELREEHLMVQQEGWSEGDDGIVRYRVLDTYAAIKEAKDDVLPALFLMGIATLIFYSLNKFVGYFDELTASVTALLKDKAAPIVLSKDLATTQSELSIIRDESIRNEQAAKHAEQRKNELIAYLAHDIRTPLTSILGYVSLLEEDGKSNGAKQTEYLHVIHSQAKKLKDMLDSFFDIARFNVQGIEVSKQDIDLQTLCMQVADELFPSAARKQLDIDVAIPQLSCSGDPNQMARALSNIMRNAIAYATLGSTIEVRGNKSNDYLEISIKNHGKMIAQENIERIFEKFFREDEARNAEQGGAGLGLAITKEIIVAHGGKIEATSNESQTVFTVCLPAGN